MLLTANGYRVVSGTISVPVSGVWFADLSVDTEAEDDLLEGIDLTLDEGPTLKGTARRAKHFLGRVGVRMVGGKGGLSKILDGGHYKGVTARIPAQDIADGAGEELDPASALDVEFPHWTRVRNVAGIQIADLARSLDLPWRVTLDGKLVMKAIDWKDSKVQPLEIMDRNPIEGTITLGRFVEPGTTILGEKVTRVEVTIGGDGLRTKAWVDDVGSL